MTEVKVVQVPIECHHIPGVLGILPWNWGKPCRYCRRQQQQIVVVNSQEAAGASGTVVVQAAPNTRRRRGAGETVIVQSTAAQPAQCVRQPVETVTPAQYAPAQYAAAQYAPVQPAQTAATFVEAPPPNYDELPRKQ